MNARPEVRRILLEKRMWKWLSAARYYPQRNPGAKRNFIRLVERHPNLAREIGLTILDAYK